MITRLIFFTTPHLLTILFAMDCQIKLQNEKQNLISFKFTAHSSLKLQFAECCFQICFSLLEVELISPLKYLLCNEA